MIGFPSCGFASLGVLILLFLRTRLHQFVHVGPSRAHALPVLFLGHPKGLLYLAFTEAWERFSYYGMTALLALFMVNELLLPGHVEHIAGFAGFRATLESLVGPLSPQALASQIFGLYSGFVYFTPVFGGWIAVENRRVGKIRDRDGIAKTVWTAAARQSACPRASASGSDAYRTTCSMWAPTSAFPGARQSFTAGTRRERSTTAGGNLPPSVPCRLHL